MLERLQTAGFAIQFLSHASAILGTDVRVCLDEIEEALLAFRLPVEELVRSGGGETHGTQRLRRALAARSWVKHNFTVARTIDGRELEAVSHQVDHVRTTDAGTLGLEIEWNNKDPFFDRDLENFKRLHADGGISAGVIVTRGPDMHREMRALIQRFGAERLLDSPEALAEFGVERTTRQRDEVHRRVQRGTSYRNAWTAQFVSDKYGEATTHWSKLQDRVRRGVGNPCPLLLIGIPARVVVFDET